MSWVGWDSSVGIATTVRAGRSGDRIPVGGKIFRTRPDRSWAHRASYTVGTRSFPGVKRPGHGVDHPSLSSVEAKEIVELYFYSPLWFRGLF